LHAQRLEAVAAVLRARGGARILDLGCGDGKLLALLAPDPQFSELVGVDASPRQLALGEARLKEVNRRQLGRVRLLQGSLVYRDQRLQGFDAVTLVEVIEHLDPPRLATMERVVFEFATPKLIVVTTPNAEYNVQFATLPAEKLRHRNHRFEWRRHEFQQWAERVARRFGYRLEVTDLAPPTLCMERHHRWPVFER
jgi:3' terminal RNA ribose 2'-O-methyltransferase Hen1